MRHTPFRFLSLALLCFLLSAANATENGSALRIGHWVRLKGTVGSDGRWIASAAELKPADKYEVLIGSVTQNSRDWSTFQLLGLPVSVSERIANKSLPAKSPGGLRLKVEGYYRGVHKFSAREIKLRNPGRDSLEGRIDEIESVDGGRVLTIMSVRCYLPDAVELEHDGALSDFLPIEPRGDLTAKQSTQKGAIDEDDEIPETIALAENLHLGGSVEWRSTMEDEFNLDETDAEDRVDHELSARARLRWIPRSDLQAVVTFRHSERWRRDDDAGRSTRGESRLSETYLWWTEPFDLDLDLILGRQDFDDPREWIYDQDLDAARISLSRPLVHAELSVSKTLSNGSTRDENTTNFIAYLSNNNQDRHLAGWIVDRRDHTGLKDSPIHFGLRALGDWIPTTESWAEFSVVKGFRDKVDYDGMGWDVGSTWSPEWLGPFDVTAGWAFGAGDDASSASRDESFIQTGFQDNNGRFGGVTSFKYYGELFNPELSNLSVYTLGIGARIAKRTSLDLVWHMYSQDVASMTIRDSDLGMDPSGMSSDLGTELDLILGMRQFKSWDLEIVAAWFSPGNAFPSGDDAFLGKFQARYKF